jgi:hypothetical protein
MSLKSSVVITLHFTSLKKMAFSPYISVSWQCISDGQTFSMFKNQINERTSELAGFVTYMVLYKALLHRNHSLNGSENTRDMAEGLTIALSLQKPPVNDLHE